MDDDEFFIKNYHLRNSFSCELWRRFAKHITWEMAITDPSKYDVYFYLSEDPSITWNRVSKNLHCPWNFVALSKHECVNMQIVKDNPQFAWDFYNLTNNKNITARDILTNPEYNWDRSSIIKRGMLPI
jgi:hypothetical protein